MAAKKGKMPFRNDHKSVNRNKKKDLDAQLQAFLNDESAQEYTFPATLTSEERAYIHTSANTLGLISKSHGKGDNRQLKVHKTEESRKKKIPSTWLTVMPQTLEAITKLLEHSPLTSNELKDVSPLEKQCTEPAGCNRSQSDFIRMQPPIIPHPVKSSAFMETRKNLPTWSHKEKILDIISKHQVVMISGDTGSGKTTQIPQYILDLFTARKEPVRIICTQPRRIAAISVAERVATERGENIGSTVGYQIRLESRVSPKTALVFCTTGILLRTLMYEEDSLQQVTHLLIDEVHERDRFVDFLLGVLRSRLPRFPHIRLIIMSAALDTNIFSSYFSNCPVLKIEGKCFPVKEYFLEEILDMTDHLNCSPHMEIGVWEEIEEKPQKNVKSQNSKHGRGNYSKSENVSQELDPVDKLKFDKLIQQMFIEDSPDAANNLSVAITSNELSVNYRHTQTQMTPLMAVAARGRSDLVELYLKFGANPSYEAGGWTAAKLARSMQHHAVADALDKNEANKLESLLRVYKDRYDDEVINFDLVMDLLHFIESRNMDGAVLVFLPGYEEILTVRDRILRHDRRFLNGSKHEVYTLHSSMQSSDQRRIFQRPSNGKRKVVLSTNLAETSITIDDIVYVINSGKVKVKSYDAFTGVTALKAEWIPQASAVQRKGRAGRCQEGICFHLFSRERFDMFEKFQIPEIIRVPIEELCLQSKNLAPADLSIAQFISLVPEAPSSLVIQRAVKLLQWMDALDPWENVTDLGRLLLELPVEPRLGKMLLTATVLRCLDPVLTITCCLSYRDPFLLPADNEEKKAAAQRKLDLAAGTLSDHMALLRAFNLWQAARANGKQREFCHRYYLSSMTMEVIHQLRAQILDQLRKSGFIRGFDELNVNASSWVAVKACILSGLYPQVARACPSGKLSTRYESSVRLHKSSTVISDDSRASQKKALASLPSEWMIYEEISRYGGQVASLRCVTLVSPLVLAIFGGHCRLPADSIKDINHKKGDSAMSSEDDEDYDEDEDDEWSDMTTDSEDTDGDDLLELCENFDNLVYNFCKNELSTSKFPRTGKPPKENPGKPMAEFCLDEWIRLRIAKDSAHQVLRLRQKWQALFARRMRNPLAKEEPEERQIIDTLLSILANEEVTNQLPPPPEFTGVAEVHCKRGAGYQNSYRTPRAGDFRPRERRAIIGNADPQDATSQVPPTLSPSSSYIRNPFYKGQKQRDFRNLKSKTGIPEVDFKSELPASPNANKSADFSRWNYNKSYDFRYKKQFSSRSEQLGGFNNGKESYSHDSPRYQEFNRQGYNKKYERPSEPRTFKGSDFKPKTSRSPGNSTRQNPRSPNNGRNIHGTTAEDNIQDDFRDKKKRFRTRGQTK